MLRRQQVFLSMFGTLDGADVHRDEAFAQPSNGLILSILERMQTKRLIYLT